MIYIKMLSERRPSIKSKYPVLRRYYYERRDWLDNNWESAAEHLLRHIVIPTMKKKYEIIHTGQLGKIKKNGRQVWTLIRIFKDGVEHRLKFSFTKTQLYGGTLVAITKGWVRGWISINGDFTMAMERRRIV